MELTNADDARFHASWSVGSVEKLEPFTDDAGTLLGWTFRVSGGQLRHGWVLTDGRVSPAFETYRAEAETYGRNVVADTKKGR
jgi:hypothetical protein